MRAKVYGKRTRILQTVNTAPFAELSPCKDAQNEQCILSEISSNSRLPCKTSHKTSPPKTKRTSDKPTIISMQDIGFSAPITPATMNEVNVECVQLQVEDVKSEIQVSVVDLDEDIALSLERLDIEDKPDHVESKPYRTARAKRPLKALQQVWTHPAQIDEETSNYVTPLLKCKNVGRCVEDFQSWMNHRSTILTIVKIGEGSFGEVYRATSSSGSVILKLMPLNAKKGRGSKSYTSIESASTEIQLLEKMQKVQGFVEFRGACVLQGAMPVQLVGLWNEYAASGRTVESKDPNKKSTYPATQLWLLIEMSDAGRNLEPGQYVPPGMGKVANGDKSLSLRRTWDVFWRIVHSLASGELYCEFEHRDLHLGNICVKDVDGLVDEEDLTYISAADDTPLPVKHSIVEVTLIDYSLSRARTSNSVLAYDFLNDKTLLSAEGDLQYDVYRYMADALGWSRTSKDFEPKTNVLWLWHLLMRLLPVTLDLSVEAEKVVEGKVTVTAKMKQILVIVRGLTKPDNMIITSAGDLLELALEKGWQSVDLS